MLDIIKILTEEFIDRLMAGYRLAFDNSEPEYEKLFAKNAEQIIQLIADSNTLYHNVEHTIQVTLVGQSILQGKLQVDDTITPAIWFNFMMSLLCHDIGYVPGICRSDRSDYIPDHASDALLMPVHIDRGKCFVEEAFSDQPGIDLDFIQACIERTRFPVPDLQEYQCTDDFPGLVRGADLIGQLSDPRYINKLPAVFFEFEESGYNKVTGYKQPGDLLSNYADFYENSVKPYVKETLDYLSMTPAGKEIIASHEANIAQAREYSNRFQRKLSVGSRHS